MILKQMVPVAVLSSFLAGVTLQAAVVPGPDWPVYEDAGVARQVEAMVETDPADPLHLIASSEDSASPYTAKRIRTYVSYDGGETWTSFLMPATGDSIVQGTPSVSFCADGTVFLCFADHSVSPSRFPIYRSTDGGMTWEERTPAMIQASALDNPYMVCDNSTGSFSGRLHVRYGSVGKIYAVHSDDQGATWSDPVQVFPTPPITSNFPGQMVIGPAGEVWIGYIKNTSPQEIRTVVSRDGGATFEPPQSVGPVSLVPGAPVVDYRRTSQPTLAVDRSAGADQGTVYLVYSDYTTGDSDLMFSRRHPTLGGWALVVRLNDDPEGNGKDQDFPRLVVDPRGVVRVVWLDHRNDPGDQSIEVWGKLSRDNGETFESDFPISDRSFLAPTGSGAFLGDIIGLTASDFVSRPLWPDRRNDDGDIYTSALRDFPLQEVKAVRVDKAGGTEVSWTSLDPVHGTETVYAVVSGALADLAADSGYLNAICLASDVPDTPYIDTRPDPSAGEGVYYLVQARRADERGSFGAIPAPDPRLRLDLAPPCP